MNRSRRLVIAPAMLALVLAACGGGTTDTTDDAAPSAPASEAAPPSEAAEPSAAASEAAASAGAGGGDATTVSLTGFVFTPAELTISAGTDVTFENGDAAPHTVTEGTDGETAADARVDEEVPAGDAVAITFDEPGTYEITCLFHPTMNMTIVVEE